mgnify:CR=1 FL=1
MRTVQIDNKARLLALAVVVPTILVSGCAGPQAFTQGQYADPEEIALLDDKWNQSDTQLVAKTVISSMEAWVGTAGIDGKPVVVLEQPKNRTSEHIDMSALYDHVIERMSYKKVGTGWGEGNAIIACDSRTGNCSDYHSYFIAIARAVVIRPSILLADEPTGNLDNATGVQVANLLFDLVNTTGMTLLLVTHNTELAQRCSRQLTLYSGTFQ